MNTKKFAIILLIAVAIAAGLFFWLNKKYGPHSKTVQKNQLSKVEKTYVDFSKAPDKFPTNIPIEAGAKITQNYNATSPDGKFQATRVFETKQALDANLSLYTDFLKKDGWEVKATTNNPTYKMVMGTKKSAILMVAIDENTINHIKTVSVTYSETFQGNSTKR